MLTVIDEYTRECLAIDVARRLKSDDVLERLAWPMATRGVPEHIRSDNGAEFTAKAVRASIGSSSLARIISIISSKNTSSTTTRSGRTRGLATDSSSNAHRRAQNQLSFANLGSVECSNPTAVKPPDEERTTI